MIKQLLFYLSLLSVSIYACGDDENTYIENNQNLLVNWQAVADSSSEAMVNMFWNPSNKYFNYSNIGLTDFHYWPQAHALDVIIDAYNRTGDM